MKSCVLHALVCGLVTWGAVAVRAEPGPYQALIVSVKKYSHRDFTELQFTDDDADRLVAVLKPLGYEVTQLSTRLGLGNPSLRPTAANIRDRIEKFPKGADGREVALVVFTGHGLQPAGRDESYFCPQDANPTLKEVPGSGNVPVEPESLIGVNWALTQLQGGSEDPLDWVA